jgi:hypothetical protein
MASRPSAKCRAASSRRTSVRMWRKVVPCSSLRCRVCALIRSRGASCLSCGWPSESSCARRRRTASVIASAFRSFEISQQNRIDALFPKEGIDRMPLRTEVHQHGHHRPDRNRDSPRVRHSLCVAVSVNLFVPPGHFCGFLIFPIVLTAALTFFSAVAQARWEAEADPTAYALEGFSVDLGHPILGERLRVRLGAFGAKTPEWVHGNSGFTENSQRLSFKFDYFPLRPSSGLFLGGRQQLFVGSLRIQGVEGGACNN